MTDAAASPTRADHSRPLPRVTIDGMQVIHVSVGMSALSANGCPVCVALGKVSWSEVVALPIRPTADWMDHVWDDDLLARQLLSRGDLIRDGIPARAVAGFVAAAIRNHVVVARLAAFQRRFVGQLLDLQDDYPRDRWLDCERYASLVAESVGLSSHSLASLADSEAALRGELELASEDVAAQVALGKAILRHGLTATAPQNRPSSLDLTIAQLAAD